MNVGLPGGGEPPTSSDTSFWIIGAGSIALVAGMLGFFRHKRWL